VPYEDLNQLFNGFLLSDGNRSLEDRPISDSVFVSRCKTVYQIGMRQHVSH